MDETAPVTATPRTASEYRAAIAAMLAELDRMHEHMDRNRIEIERLARESAAIRFDTEKVIARIDARLAAIQDLL